MSTHTRTQADSRLMDSNTALATYAFWRINNCWNGHEHCTVGYALRTLNGARNQVGPHRSIYWKIDKLIQDIVHNQASPAAEQQHAS